MVRRSTSTLGIVNLRHFVAAAAGAFCRGRSQCRFSRNAKALAWSESGIRGTDLHGTVSEFRWDEITGVLWCEPTYGFFEGVPCWVIHGPSGDIIEIEDYTYGSESDDLPQWLARKLPGFDPSVVSAAFERGFFRQPGTQHLVCWSRPEPGNERPDA
jgi:hypothetical protein